MPKVLMSTIPFGDKNYLNGITSNHLIINSLNQKLTEDELAETVTDFDLITAGIKLITKKVYIQVTI